MEDSSRSRVRYVRGATPPATINCVQIEREIWMLPDGPETHTDRSWHHSCRRAVCALECVSFVCLCAFPRPCATLDATSKSPAPPCTHRLMVCVRRKMYSARAATLCVAYLLLTAPGIRGECWQYSRSSSLSLSFFPVFDS